MATLAEALYAQPTEVLRELVAARAVDMKRIALAPDKRQLVQLLAAELTRPQSLNAAALQCNARELRLLQIIVSQMSGAPLLWKHVVEATGGPELEPVLGQVLAGLTRAGVAFRVGQTVFVPDAVRNQIPQSLSDRYTLERLLNQYDAPALKRLVENHGLRPGTKNVNIEGIRKVLLSENSLVRLYKPLTDDERRVLEYMVQVGGDALPTEVASEVLGGKTDEFFRYDWQNRWKQGRERNAVDNLLGKGLLFVMSPLYGYNLILVMPGDVLRALTGTNRSVFWTEPAPAPKPLPTPPHTKRHTTLIRDVVSLLGFVATQEVARTNTGYIHKTSLKNAVRTFSLPEERYGSFVYALCREAGLMAPQGDKQTYALTAAGETWLQKDSVEQQTILFTAWRSGTLWGEMFADPLQKANVYRSKELMAGIRSAALRMVTASATDAFIDLVSLTDALSFGSPLLLVETAQQSRLVSSPLIFTRLLVGECLYWLGMAEIGTMEAETSVPGIAKATKTSAGRGEVTEKAVAPEITGFRLTPAGAIQLEAPGHAPLPADPREDKFIVQANAEIFVPPYLAPAIFYHLLTLTELPAKGATGNTVHLTRDSIRRLLDRGATVRDILTFLQSHARTGIPQNVEYLINEVGGKHGHIHVGKALTYIQVDSPVLLKELQARREIKAHFVRTLGDTVAIMDVPDTEILLRDLRKAGYLPVNDDASLQNPLLTHPPSEEIESAKAAPGRPAGKSAKTVTAAAMLDWERIARDDGKPWSSAGSGSLIPPDAVQGKAQIAQLMRQAAENDETVQFIAPNMAEPRALTPAHVYGNYVQGYDTDSDMYETHTLSAIIWARLL